MRVPFKSLLVGALLTKKAGVPETTKAGPGNAVMPKGIEPKVFSGPLPAPYHPKEERPRSGESWDNYPRCALDADLNAMTKKHMTAVDWGKTAVPFLALGGVGRSTQENILGDYATNHFRKVGDLEDVGICYLKDVADANLYGRVFRVTLFPLSPEKSVPRTPVQDEAIHQYEAAIKDNNLQKTFKTYEIGGDFFRLPDGRLRVEMMVSDSSSSVEVADKNLPNYLLSIHNHPSAFMERSAFPTPEDYRSKRYSDDEAKVLNKTHDSMEPSVVIAGGNYYEYWGTIPPQFNKLTPEVGGRRPKDPDIY